MVFINLEKAYECVSREILKKALENKGGMCWVYQSHSRCDEGVMTSVKTPGRVSNDFPITIVLHQGSTFSSYLFNIVLDVLTENIQEEIHKSMLFADDIVLLCES